jgi:uncharacterized membrane protein YkgB
MEQSNWVKEWLSMEKIYKTMRGAGVINIVIGSVIITAGLAAGILAIVSGALLLKRKSEITF